MCLDNPFQTYWKSEQSVFLSCAKITCRIYLKKIIFAIIFNWKSLVLLSNKTIFLKKTQWKSPYLLFSGRCIFKPVTNICGHVTTLLLTYFFLESRTHAAALQQQACPTIHPGEGSTGGYTGLRSWLGQSQDSSRGNTQHLYLDRCQGLLSQHCCRWSQLCTQNSPGVCSIPWCSTDGSPFSLGSAFSEDYFSLLKQCWKSELGYRLDIFFQTWNLTVMFTKNK